MSKQQANVTGGEQRDYPVGIPVRPPPGWRPRPVIAPPPLPSRRHRASGPQPIGVVVKAALIGLMVLVCMGVGWLSVQGPKRKARSASEEKVTMAAPGPTPGKNARVRSRTPTAKQPVTPAPRPEPPPQEKEKKPTPAPEPKRPQPAPVPMGPVLTYEEHVVPILERSCLNCHNPTKKRGRLDLSTRMAALRGGESGTSVKPGKPDESLLLQSIVRGEMPPSGAKMRAEDLKTIRDWIASGARGK